MCDPKLQMIDLHLLPERVTVLIVDRRYPTVNMMPAEK